MGKSTIYHALGLMSGSSLDGLDIVYAKMKISHDPVTVDWELITGETLPYSEIWIRRLSNLPQQSAISFAQTNVYYSYYIAELVNNFISKHQVKPDFIAAHGHTIFHDPDRRFTTQIGDGGALAALTRCPVICNFRTNDIALNGEGTPIAPAADRYLFPEYDFYLNLGGIANITANTGDSYIAFDTAPANQVFNALAQLNGKEYDDDGKLAGAGKLIPELYEQITTTSYFKKPYPKSLDNNWIRKEIIALFYKFEASIEDRMHTAVQVLVDETIRAIQLIIKKEKMTSKKYQMLITGGGAFNLLLLKLLKEKSSDKLNMEIILPEKSVINFKEALLMVLMGALRMEELPNCFSSVTGAKNDTIGGAIYTVPKISNA